MSNEMFFAPLRRAVREGNLRSVAVRSEVILKRAALPDTEPRLRTEIYLEAARGLRALDQISRAENLCDIGIANIPARSSDLLSALNRLRSLLYADGGNLEAARNLIDSTDGLELVLEKGQSMVNRSEDDVEVETWLISCEVAMAQDDIAAAQNYFDLAVSRLSRDEALLRGSLRVNPGQKQKLERYYYDLTQLLKLNGLALGLISGNQANALAELREMRRWIAEENEAARGSRKLLPNVPLLSKINCLLGEITVSDDEDAPLGLSRGEALRWIRFGGFDESSASPLNCSSLVRTEAVADVSVEVPVEVSSSHAVFPAGLNLSSARTADYGDLMPVTVSLLEKMTASLLRFEELMPEFVNFLRRTETETLDYSERYFGGHLLETDLYNLLHNVRLLQFTGIVEFKWASDLYDSAIVKGLLPDIVRVGAMNLYAVNGMITDAVFKGQNEINTVESARANFELLTRMSLSIKTDDIPPNIVSKSKREPAAADRPALLEINDKSLFYLAADLDESAAGIEKDSGELNFFESQDAAAVSAARQTASCDDAKYSETNKAEISGDDMKRSENSKTASASKTEAVSDVVSRSFDDNLPEI